MQSYRQKLESFHNSSGDEQVGVILLLQHTLAYRVIQEGQKLVIEAIDIEEHGGFGVELQRLPCQHLKHLFEGSEAARKYDERVSLLGHESFASVHCVYDVKL